MTNWQFIKQLFRCMIGKHVWWYAYQGVEGYSRDCKYCGKSEDVDYKGY